MTLLTDRRGRLSVLVVAIVLLGGASTHPAGAVAGRIPLTVTALGGPQPGTPVFVGVPFPPATCYDPASSQLVTNGRAAPRQAQVLSLYPDGSLRVVLIGFRLEAAAGPRFSAAVRFGGGRGIVLNPPPRWNRDSRVLARCSPRWYGESTVFNLPFLASADNALAPPFEARLRAQFTRTSDPPANLNPDIRNYYDHLHALYMTLLRRGGPATVPLRIAEELARYREREILHTGPFRGQYSAGSYTTQSRPINFGNVRRMFPQGLLDDYYVTGDPRSLEVAREIGEALLADATQQRSRFTWTERIPGWEIMGLCALYEATLELRYLEGAKRVAAIAMDHQDAMARKYPNQGGVSGQTGGFLQDRNGRWFDAAESTASGAGSPFMTTLLGEGLIRLYWLTGDVRVRASLVGVADWLADAAFVGADNPANPTGTDSFWYVCRDAAKDTVYPSLNPMFLQLLGFGHQATGDPKYLSIARRVLAVNDWGNQIKEFNQALHSSGQGLWLLSAGPGKISLTLSDADGRSN